MKDAPIPDHIGRYQILERVGQGGMGVLYRGFDPKLDREVAIKVILTDFSEDAEQLRPRFYREAKATARLQHRNIVTVFEFAEDQNQPHIVMEFLRGIPLAKRMTSSPPLTLDDKLDVVAQLCAGLGYAHSQGVIHRDVKPANMFLLEDGTVKLLDFGIAKLATSTLTKQGDVLGSPSYMSPEQVAGSDSVDGRADVWSTGVVLYELLAGRKPFEGETPTNVIVKILKEEPKPIESIVPTLPKQLVSAVHRALQKDPGKRIAKADELGRELQWIRKALQASGELAPMEETKFASTQVLKALHEDLQQQKTGTISAKTLAGVAVVDPPATAPKKWVLPAGLAAVVVAGVAGWALLGGTMGSRGSTAKPVEAPAGATTPAPPPAQKPGEVSMLAANSNPGPPPSASVPSGSTAPASVPPASAPFASAARATPPAPSTPRPAAAATKEAPPPATEPKPAAPPVMVEVTMTSPVYAFEVLDGNRAISPPGREHTLAQPNGKTLRVVAGDVLLDQQVRVDGDADKRFEWAAPALGRLDIRARRENCKVLIGKRDFGNPPLVIPVVVGDYAVVLSCPDGQNPSKPATVSPGRASQVLFTEQ